MATEPERHAVTAVLVAHDGAHWLPETLKAVLTQTRPVDRLIVADTGSRDAGPALLREVAGDLLALPRGTSYAQAVTHALYDREPETGEWLWLLHDDSEPAHDALHHLLATAEAHPPADILGPKLRDWDDRHILLEAGVAIDRTGRRDTRLDDLEYDQGQHDTVREVMAVSTAGLLVRRTVWDELGGLDPAFGLFREDIDFGWRAYTAGHRVLIAPAAVMYHAEASARGLRSYRPAVPEPATRRGRRVQRDEAGAGRRRRTEWVEPGARVMRAVAGVDRRNALLVLLANLPLLAVVRVPPMSLVRALWLLIAGRTGEARIEVAALRGALRHTYRMRRVRKPGLTHRNVARFQPSWPTLRRLPERLAGRRLPAVDVWSLVRRPPVLMFLALALIAVVAAGRPPQVAGGASDLWARYLSGWHPAGLGSAAPSPPYVAVLAVLSTLLFGKVWLAVTVLLAGSVPLAGLTGYAAARQIIGGGPVALWAGATYGLLPAVTGAVTGGRLGTAVVAVLLPLIGLFAYQMLDPRARYAAWAAALLLAVAMAFAPLVWPLIAVAGLIAGYVLDQPRTAIVLIAPPLLLPTWWCGLLAHPSRLLHEAGLPHDARTSPVELITLGAPAAWITGGLLLTGLAALLLRRRRTTVLAGWLLALTGLLTATLVATQTTWPGTPLANTAAGVILAASVLLQRALAVLRTPPAKTRLRRLGVRAGALVVVAAAVATPVLAAGHWLVAGRPDRHATAVPASVAADAGRSRLLVLSPRKGPGGVAYVVVRGGLPLPGDEATPTPGAARERFSATVAGLVAGTEDGSGLARFGVGYVTVPLPGGEPLVAALDAAPELSPLSRTSRYALWGLATPAGRLTLVDGTAATPLATGPITAHVRIPPGHPGRTLLLAEPADPGWHATLDGRHLRPGPRSGWGTEWQVPATGGEFELRRGMLLRHLELDWQALVLLVIVVRALPFTNREPRRRGRRRAPGRPVLIGGRR